MSDRRESFYWQRWTLGIFDPDAEHVPMIRQAFMLFGRTDKEENEDRRLVLGQLVDWANAHPTHPDLPQWAGKSYLKEPFDPIGMTAEEMTLRLEKQGCRITWECGPVFGPNEEDDDG